MKMRRLFPALTLVSGGASRRAALLACYPCVLSYAWTFYVFFSQPPSVASVMQDRLVRADRSSMSPAMLVLGTASVTFAVALVASAAGLVSGRLRWSRLAPLPLAPVTYLVLARV